MRFTVFRRSRLASKGIAKGTIEEAVEFALMIGAGDLDAVSIEDQESGKTYRGDEITGLRKLLK